MENKTILWSRDSTFIAGLILFAISALAFLGVEQTDVSSWTGRPSGEWFFLHYMLFVSYLIGVAAVNHRQYGRFYRFRNLRHNIMLLLLANVSCYALNREIAIFATSTDWLSVYLVILNIALLAFSFKKYETPSILATLIVVILSTGIFFNFYESIYILPACLFGVVGFWFFGIPMHVFVPLWFFILLSKIVKKYVNKNPDLKFPALAGIFIPVFIVAGMTIRWHQINSYINEVYAEENIPRSEIDLPYWVRLGQRLDYNWMTDHILKSGWFYYTPEWEDGIDGMFNGRRKEHDPFVIIASLFGGKLDMDTSTKGKIYTTLTNNRHSTESRLWSGNNLETKDITTNVQLIPTFRLAYTEKTLTIHNSQENRGWNRPQEAIYTFHLPEGSVVTSASLWVNGVESPAYLTTRSKADSAYKAIVGVERRDPLLVHWQEGNRITARIFPCTVEEDRVFKLGITTPLLYEDGELIYQNIDFQGPSWSSAEEHINVIMEGKPIALETSLWMNETRDGWSWKGEYVSDWTMRMPAPPLNDAIFTFNGRTFQNQLYEPTKEPFKAETIYLDINQDWSKRDFRKLWSAIQAKKVYVFTSRLHEMTVDNKDDLFEELQDLRYSLFPFHQIKNPQKALVISAYGALTPSLDDLKNSAFSKNLQPFLLEQTQPIKVFNFGQELTPYLKTLKETRIIHETSGDIEDLLQHLQEATFPESIENEATIVLDKTAMKIIELEKAAATSTAPDHLMRLFVYNDLMRKIGRTYFEKQYLTEFLIEDAKEAYILSPISSLVTLETKEDYERFDIKKSENSLNNANWDSSGSVPEPHEWILLILSLLLIAYLRREQLLNWQVK